jgi:acid stress-induced BolA-like protein IbaG/YrbA
LVRPINDACVSGDQLNLFYHGVLRLGCELGEEAEMQQFRISLFLGAALALQTISIELAGVHFQQMTVYSRRQLNKVVKIKKQRRVNQRQMLMVCRPSPTK